MTLTFDLLMNNSEKLKRDDAVINATKTKVPRSSFSTVILTFREPGSAPSATDHFV